MAFLIKKRPYHFEVTVGLVQLSAVPLVNGVMFAKLRLVNSHRTNQYSPRKPIEDHCVQWASQHQFACKTSTNSDTNVLEPILLKISIRQETRGGKSFTKVGYVLVNVACFAGCGEGRVTRRYILTGYDQKHRQDNSLLQVDWSVRQTAGDTCFRVSPEDTSLTVGSLIVGGPSPSGDDSSEDETIDADTPGSLSVPNDPIPMSVMPNQHNGILLRPASVDRGSWSPSVGDDSDQPQRRVEKKRFVPSHHRHRSDGVYLTFLSANAKSYTTSQFPEINEQMGAEIGARKTSLAPSHQLDRARSHASCLELVMADERDSNAVPLEWKRGSVTTASSTSLTGRSPDYANGVVSPPSFRQFRLDCSRIDNDLVVNEILRSSQLSAGQRDSTKKELRSSHQLAATTVVNQVRPSSQQPKRFDDS